MRFHKHKDVFKIEQTHQQFCTSKARWKSNWTRKAQTESSTINFNQNKAHNNQQFKPNSDIPLNSQRNQRTEYKSHEKAHQSSLYASADLIWTCRRRKCRRKTVLWWWPNWKRKGNVKLTQKRNTQRNTRQDWLFTSSRRGPPWAGRKTKETKALTRIWGKEGRGSKEINIKMET